MVMEAIMIELRDDSLVFSFPGVHPEARLTVDFQRTLRIPDDGGTYPLPPGLGSFPLRHVDDFAGRVPVEWEEHGGVMLPMYQSEAMWLSFHSSVIISNAAQYPFAVKVAAGKIDAVSGESWTRGLHGKPQDYLVIPGQPWLDGFCVEKGAIRQFVAMPLGAGYTAEEQITGRAEHGGLQIAAFPMRREAFERRFPRGRRSEGRPRADTQFCLSSIGADASMGLAPGGRMRQEIYEDEYDFDDWDRQTSSRCFVHISNSLMWRAVTGSSPPTVPVTAEEYERHRLPWFDYYDEGLEALEGSERLAKLESVIRMGREAGDVPLPENETVDPGKIVRIRGGSSEGRVREGSF